MLNRLVAASAVMAATLAPALASAQDERSSPVPRYHLMQLSVDTAATTPEEFKAKSEAIRTCGEAKDLAKSLDAGIKRNRFVRASSLPADLQDVLLELPAGHATPVFSDDDGVMRVLVLCGRN